MAVASAPIFTICDAATIRESLLHVLGAGINRAWRNTFPATLGSYVAMQIHVRELGPGEDVTLLVTITNADGSDASIPSFETSLSELSYQVADVTIPFSFPFILDARELPIARPGDYKMTLSINGVEASSIYFDSAPFEVIGSGIPV